MSDSAPAKNADSDEDIFPGATPQAYLPMEFGGIAQAAIVARRLRSAQSHPRLYHVNTIADVAGKIKSCGEMSECNTI